jgi:hypothetical protein
VAQSFGFKVPPTVDLSMFNLICWPWHFRFHKIWLIHFTL